MTGVTQYNAITSYETQRNIPVYYLLYNPRQIPSVAVVPLVGERDPGPVCAVQRTHPDPGVASLRGRAAVLHGVDFDRLLEQSDRIT